METTLINIKDTPLLWQRDPRYVYIGRRDFARRLGIPVDKAVYGNPHPISLCNTCKKYHTRKDAVETHAAEMRILWAHDDRYRAQIELLRGRVLVCHCRPLACHGDVYLELLKRNGA